MAYINGNKILSVEATGLVNIDTEMSDTSENPVQNKVIKGYVDEAIANAGGGENSGESINGITEEDGVIVFTKPVRMQHGLDMDDTSIECAENSEDGRGIVNKGYVDAKIGDIEALLGGI